MPDNLLVQTFERVIQDEIRGQVFVYVDGCREPKHRWKLMPHHGYLNWTGFLDWKPPVDAAYMNDIFVDGRYRRRGLGAVLVEHAENRMRAFGITYVKGIAKKEGEAFWESLGYKLDRDTSWFEKTLGVRARWFEKTLREPRVVPSISRVIDIERQYSLEQLKQMSRQRGVSTAGSKRDIIRRLL